MNNTKTKKRERIVVAMSGGVDSAVAAALMVEAGYDVVGITLQLYDHGRGINGSKTCCAGSDISDARRVANQLKFPHYVLNYEERFKTAVIDDFADSYLRGETPIPCVRCNQTVKFYDLISTAKKLGAEAMVTGHYVRRKKHDSRVNLYRGLDLKKDQSYFLFSTTQAQLNYLRFPLGVMEKRETREHATRLGLDISEKPESQDICFVPNGNYPSLIKSLRPNSFKSGDIVDMQGRFLGKHDGVSHFTVGQRRGLGVACGKPLYVIKIEPMERRVIVGPAEALLTDGFQVKDINWLGDYVAKNEEINVDVKVRSSSPPIPAILQLQNDKMGKVRYFKPQSSTAPGQAAVFYEEDRVLGGGWII